MSDGGSTQADLGVKYQHGKHALVARWMPFPALSVPAHKLTSRVLPQSEQLDKSSMALTWWDKASAQGSYI